MVLKVRKLEDEGVEGAKPLAMQKKAPGIVPPAPLLARLHYPECLIL